MSEPMTPEREAATRHWDNLLRAQHIFGEKMVEIDRLRAANKEAESEFLKERARVKELEEALREIHEVAARAQCGKACESAARHV